MVELTIVSRVVAHDMSAGGHEEHPSRMLRLGVEGVIAAISSELHSRSSLP